MRDMLRLLLSAGIIGGGTFAWMLLHAHFRLGLFTFIACWPALLLARSGIWQSWLTLPPLLLLVVATLSLLTRRRSWTQHCLLSTFCLVAYCLVGQLAYPLLAWKTPSKIPSGLDMKQRQEYASGYRYGYQWGMGGTIRSYCFAPKYEEIGFNDGFLSGFSVFYRFLGKPEPWRNNHSRPDVTMEEYD